MGTQIESVEAYIKGGIDLIDVPRVRVGCIIRVNVFDRFLKDVSATCLIKESEGWDPRRGSIGVKGVLVFPDGRKRKFSGSIAVATTITIELEC